MRILFSNIRQVKLNQISMIKNIYFIFKLCVSNGICFLLWQSNWHCKMHVKHYSIEWPNICFFNDSPSKSVILLWRSSVTFTQVDILIEKVKKIQCSVLENNRFWRFRASIIELYNYSITKNVFCFKLWSIQTKQKPTNIYLHKLKEMYEHILFANFSSKP